ncbi:hypothetical protein [Streptomyces sp. NPDC088775]|uniref:hypothetical protein n=1 Tax=Streptomyces sp. NPDC088775 TaxID=3365896 RepID=UPI0038099F33
MKRWVITVAAGGLLLAGCSSTGDTDSKADVKPPAAKVYSAVEMQEKWTPVLQGRSDDMGPMTAAVCMPPALFTGDCDEAGKALAGDADTLVQEVGGRPGFSDLLKYAHKVQEARDTYVSRECQTRPSGAAYTECALAGRTLSLAAQSLLAGVNAAATDSQKG